MSLVYLDNNATTMVDPEVLEAMLPFLKDQYFNPSSMYDAARGPKKALENARKQVASFFKVHDDEVLFTSCATESNNTAIFGVAMAVPSKRHVITSAVEHPAVLNVCKELERRGYEVSYIPVKRNGELDVRAFVRELRPGQTLMVSIMHANNETGVIFPVEELSRIVKETDPSIVFHTDATQSVTKLPINMAKEFRHVDLLSFSGHKIHAPKGVGALIVRRGTPIRPFMYGGHQEGGRRGGTENVAFIVGLAKALEVAERQMEEVEAKVRAMRDRLEKGLLEKIPYLEVNGAGAPRVASTLNVACHFVEGEGMLYQLSAHGICASSGSACTSGSLDPSHVLKAMGVPMTAIHGSVRFSFSRFNREEDVDRVLEVFPEVVARLRRLSPYWDTKTNSPRPEGMKLLEESAGG